MTMTPEEIIELRGDLSREEFAELVGVTPLTVYRWELDPSANESRRPQRRLLKRLREVAQTRDIPRVDPPRAIASTPRPVPNKNGHIHQGALSTEAKEAFELIMAAEWHSADVVILQLFSSIDESDAVAGQVAQALMKLLWKNDVRGAFALLAPVIRQADELSPDLAGRVHLTAALLFSCPDGQIFSAGRVSSHVARAEKLLDESDLLALLRVAELWAAYHFGDANLMARIRGEKDHELVARGALVRRLLQEVQALETYLSGCVVDAIAQFEETIEAAFENDFPLVAVRSTALLASVELFAATPVDEVQAKLKRARDTANLHRLEPGWVTLALEAAWAECLSRRGEFDECLDHLERSRELARSAQWPPVELVYTWARVLYLTGDVVGLRNLPDKILVVSGGHRSTLTRSALTFAEALLNFSENLALSANKFALAGELELECGTLPQLKSYAFSMAFYAATLNREPASATEYLRRAEQALERVPLYWTTAVLRLFKSVQAALDSRVDEAEQHVDAAETAFKRVSDQAQCLLAARVRLMNTFLLGRDVAAEFEESDQAWEALGLEVPAPYRIEAVERLRDERYAYPRGQCATRDVVFSGAQLLAVYMNRLSVRGLSVAQILEELFDVTKDLLGIPDSCLAVEELTSTGVQTLFKTGPEPSAFIEFGDGLGRRFRLGLSASIPRDQYTALNLLTHVASLAMEATSLRASRSLSRAVTYEDHTPVVIPGFIAKAAVTKRLVQEIQRLGNSRASVLIGGESGVGKEVVAHAVYSMSTRKNRAFVTFNCSAVPRELFEGQLFGYRKGAFTGATSHHPGVIRAADGGTLFLDEIGDLPLDLQPKLLRFLENGEVFPLGETHATKVDVRVIAATHRDLEQMVKEGKFREDLYYRLAVVSLEIPPLRERPEDIAPIAQHFIEQFEDENPPKLAQDAAERLRRHEWPGNVRELRNVIERSLAYTPLPKVLTAADLRF